MNPIDMPLSVDVVAPQPMDDAELQSIINGELQDAVSYIDSDISPIRAKGTEYYRGDPFGNEEDGRSQVVAEAPEVEISRYAIDIRSITHGTGDFTREPAGYAPVPAALAKKLIEG